MSKIAYQLQFNNRGSILTCYSDFFVLDNGFQPVMMSVVGDDSTIKALIACVYTTSVEKMLSIEATEFVGNRTIGINVSFRRYKAYVSAVDGLTHALLIARDLIELPNEEKEGEYAWRYVVAKDGDIEKAFTRYIMENTTTPFLPEWGPKLYEYILKIPKLHAIIKHRSYGDNPLQIIEVRKNFDEIVCDAIKEDVLTLPSSQHDAIIDKDTTISEYISQNSNVFARRINDAYQPRHSIDDPVSPRMCELKRSPFAAQEVVIQGMVNTLNELRSGIVVGEMGTGKTLIGASIPYVHSDGKPYRAIVMAPGHLVKKWKREIEETVPGSKATIIKDWKHLVQTHNEIKRKPNGIEYYVISRDRAKLGYFTRCGARWHEHSGQWKCPRCGETITTTEKQDEGWWSSKKVDVEVPAPKKHFDKPKKSNAACRNCGESLWYADNKRTRRYAPAEFIKRKMRGYFDYFIADEVHELKGTSAQGNVLGALASVARKTIALTGTLLGGYASDLFYILYRLNASRMKGIEQLEYSDATKWERRYGSIERITKTLDEDFNISSRGSNKKVTVKKRPGVSSLVFTKHLLDMCAFVELSDIENELPEYEEIVKPVDMDLTQRAAYKEIAEKLEHEVKKFGTGQRFLGVYLTNLLSYPDQPFNATPIRSPIDGSTLITPLSLDSTKLLPKEEELLDIVKSELKEGRRVFVYATFTGKRGIQKRLQSVLETNVPDVKISVLEPKVKPEQREEWISKEIKAGANVIIGNPKLVETGIDLTGDNNCPSLVFYQTGYSLFTLRQASRRSWRIGQTEKVRVYFLAYKDTLQYAALQLMGAKMEAAMSIEGKLSEEGLRSMSGDLDITSALAKAISQKITGIDSAETIFSRLNKNKKSHN